MTLFRERFPNVTPLEGSPERILYWMAVHLPLARHEKQRLLQLPNTATRLKHVRVMTCLTAQTECRPGLVNFTSQASHPTAAPPEPSSRRCSGRCAA